jgi:hypothetical protein
MFGLSGSELRREVKDVLLEIDVSVERWNPVEPVEPAYEVEGLSENDDVFVLVVARVVVVLARVGLGDDDDGVEGVWVVRLERGAVDFGVEALMAILVLHIGK